MQVIGAMIVRRFELELADDQRIEADPQFTLRPRYGMRMNLLRRR